MKSYQLKVLIVTALFWLYGCTFTQSYPPEFNNRKKAITDSLKAKYGFEDITFMGKTISGNGGKHTSLTVKFINGKAIPTDTAQQTGLEKILGAQIKTILKNPKEFDSYIIIFDKVVVDGNVTNEDYTGHEFKVDSL
jgi:hypothetical protein